MQNNEPLIFDTEKFKQDWRKAVGRLYNKQLEIIHTRLTDRISDGEFSVNVKHDELGFPDNTDDTTLEIMTILSQFLVSSGFESRATRISKTGVNLYVGLLRH